MKWMLVPLFSEMYTIFCFSATSTNSVFSPLIYFAFLIYMQVYSECAGHYQLQLALHQFTPHQYYLLNLNIFLWSIHSESNTFFFFNKIIFLFSLPGSQFSYTNNKRHFLTIMLTRASNFTTYTEEDGTLFPKKQPVQFFS